MIPNASKELAWLKDHPHTLRGIRRGIERETLRVNPNGSLAVTGHPEILGSVLTHKWITIDFSEALLEFITPVKETMDHTLTIMRDIHRYAYRALGEERMWPLSMPCYIDHEKKIKVAQYGTSNIGRLKTLYRVGLKNRYGALMQIISGVHYNFSLPVIFWKERYGKTDKNTISNGYFRLIRNYYRFGWIIPYLFGASPSFCSSFLRGRKSRILFEKTNKGMYYLPYATSLRMSHLGYNSELQRTLGISFNNLHEYVAGLKHAITTPSVEYEKIGLEKDGRRLQINSNLLQIENELYVPIRPKRVVCSGETPSDALLRGGVEYVEVRSLDINPFSPIGIDEKQIRFLDLFMIWCVLAEAPEMNSDELFYTHIDWNRVVLEGRKPGIKLGKNKTKQYPLQKIGEELLQDLVCIAKTFDTLYGNDSYQRVCYELLKHFDNPELTLSARILRSMIDRGFVETACSLAEEYCRILKKEQLVILSDADFSTERDASIVRQRKIEEEDSESFSVFLENRNGFR